MKVGTTPITITIVLFVLLLSFSHAYSTTPQLKGHVNDMSGTLSPSEAQWITDLCLRIDENSGVEIAILIVNISQDTDISEYATDVFTYNGIGKEGKDNGVLIVIDPRDNNWIIQVGYGLEGDLNDAKLGYIGRTILEPNIDDGMYAEGIYETIIALDSQISGQDDVERTWLEKNWKILIAILVLIIILILTKGRILIWIGTWFVGKRWGGGRTGGGMGKR
jgi:uncharacterized protein